MTSRGWLEYLLSVREQDQVSTWRLLPAFLAVAFAVRATVALGGDFVLHPDEIMQYLEPAHKAVFGNGIVFWEYEYGGRSWIVPGIIAVILWILDFAGLGDPWVYVYVVKIVFCVISLLIPWGSYHFTRRTLGDESAKLALVVTCLWPYLVVFAHKPFTEFVSASLLFGGLGLASMLTASSRKGAVALGAMLAMSGAIRMQYLPLTILAWLASVAMMGRASTIASVVGIVIVVVLVALLETLTWGAPFNSYYVNFVVNLELDKTREAQGLIFYLPRLLFATAGCALIALYAFFRHPRRHMLAIFLTLITLALHMSQPHKEFRFVFVLIPLCLIVACDHFAMLASRWPRAFSPRTLAAASTAILLLVGGNLVDDRWLHDAASRERSDVQYLFGQSNIFDVYLEIARLEDVKGVLHLGDLYYNTPGYYYLHQDVPFYDSGSFAHASSETGTEEPEEFVSHLITNGEFPRLPGYLKISTNGSPYHYGFIEGATEVRQWQKRSIMLLTNTSVDIARSRLGVKDAVKPPLFEFVD